MDVQWHLQNLQMYFDQKKLGYQITVQTKCRPWLSTFQETSRSEQKDQNSSTKSLTILWNKGYHVKLRKTHCPLTQGKELLHPTRQCVKPYETSIVSVQHHFSGLCSTGAWEIHLLEAKLCLDWQRFVLKWQVIIHKTLWFLIFSTKRIWFWGHSWSYTIIIYHGWPW